MWIISVMRGRGFLSFSGSWDSVKYVGYTSRHVVVNHHVFMATKRFSPIPMARLSESVGELNLSLHWLENPSVTPVGSGRRAMSILADPTG